MFQNDYILREIEGLTRFLAKVLFGKEVEYSEILDEQNLVSEDGLFRHTLLRMISDGSLNQAENLLHETIEENPRKEHLDTALYFYSHLNRMTDRELEAADFSREEIAEGLEAVKGFYISM